MIGIPKKQNPAKDGPCSANPRPYGISGANGNGFHRLRDAEEAQDDKDHRDGTWNEFRKPFAEFQRDGKADLKKACE